MSAGDENWSVVDGCWVQSSAGGRAAFMSDPRYARLVAAAPELLDLLGAALSTGAFCECDHPACKSGEVAKAIRALIARIEGG